jgi:hypothetical protein
LRSSISASCKANFLRPPRHNAQAANKLITAKQAALGGRLFAL